MDAPVPLRLLLLLWFLSWQMPAAGEEEGQSGSSTMWSFTRPDLMLRPYDWAYLRVDLPPWFSSVTMGFTSGVDINNKQIKKLPKSTLPVICFSQGRPPLPDISSAVFGFRIIKFCR
ncbi:hypothetical protein HPP92_022326 [Vanilla planifolia]|uniref:Uncharacterized protein n=1 Tax=Vanilla planifolia TaxID=51239 RepID=A0A835PY11_VANPL|nr:hypothetical protein HPP92_022326 [Vanilla planifolia]